MLNLLFQVEKELPNLLLEQGWSGVDITYHPPRVERVWRQWGENRISLHAIHPCPPSKSLFHPHPWPSAMRIVKGEYEMAVGYGAGIDIPAEACKIVLVDGSCYEMTHPDGWHSVRPLSSICWTVMVSGKPWNREMNEVPHEKPSPLSIDRIHEILSLFQNHYPVVKD